jgi:hypothetical protein
MSENLAIILYWVYMPVFVLLSLLSWDSPTHPPWDYTGSPPIGPTLVICDMLSVVLTTTICLSALFLFLWIVGRRCTMNGKLRTSLLQELATPLATAPTATVHLPSSAVPSVAATGGHSQQPSRSQQDTVSHQPTPFDFARVPVIRLPAPAHTYRSIPFQDWIPRLSPPPLPNTPSPTSSLNAPATPLRDLRPSARLRPMVFALPCPPLLGDSLCADSSGPPRTSSSPSTHLTLTSGRLRREAFMAMRPPTAGPYAEESDSDYDPYDMFPPAPQSPSAPPS